MNPVALGIGVATYSTKKMIVIVLISIAVILSLPMLAVASMGTSALSFLASSPNAMAAESKGFYMGGMVPGNTYEWGNCTYWAYAKRYWAGHPIGQYWGNANTWDESALAEDYIVNHTPAAGAIFQTDEGKWGHVAYVTNVNPITGEWTISEMNAPNLNVVSERTFSKESAGYYDFIHDKKGAPTWIPQPTSNSSLPTGN
ncbi:CHAP domain-containing protein [Candidatus Saccharibacteria bacterium]|nr:CHAP domain-containing protein [Candidatus Saccharibacteria bacterium]